MTDSKATTSNRVSSPDEESGSLTLSISPPNDETSTISEHLSSIENDRSMQEIEVPHLPDNFALLLRNVPDERISQETLNSSFNSSSIISLNGLERFINTNMESKNSARSVLEEILSNDQFKSDQDESLDIFANVDLDDKLLNSYNAGKSANFNIENFKNDSINGNDEVWKRLKDFEEIIAVKDTTIAALTSELDSFRELVSNTSTNSLGTSTTEYKQYQEECHNKLVEYHNAIIHKDEQIEKLTNSLQQSILNREEMKQQLRNEIEQLQEQLSKTSAMLKEHKCVQKIDFNFDETCSKLEGVLTSSQVSVFNELKLAINNHLKAQKKELEDELKNLKLGGLKEELDAKHSNEMEELRTYFEKKCADLEKNYSEEVFSQQSRKMSGSSSCSEISSDFIFGTPGPGGDVKVEYTKKDITKMRHVLTQMISLLNNYNLDNLSNDDLDKLKTEISKFELQTLLKCDLGVIRAELQNKYHAELEILREDFDNRVDMNNVEHERKLKDLEKRYMEEIEDLNVQLRGRISTTAQEVANSGEFEIDEVVQSYERRLQEQVTLAKIDIIHALECQIQRLVASDNIDDDWPEELLRLKTRFAEKYQQEIISIKNQHEAEIMRLKDEHLKALDRARRRSLRDADSLSKGEIELLKERDLLKKQTLSLKNLLGELLKYFTQCEDELNNTLVEELLTKNMTQVESEQGKRVHLTPNFNDLISMIDNSPESELESIDLKGELGSCLQKLKSDANAILALTTNLDNADVVVEQKPPKNGSLERQLSSLTRKLISETQEKNELNEQLCDSRSVVQSLEIDRMSLEKQLDDVLDKQKVLESDLHKARGKIAELIENGHKEIVSEGYGEDGHRSVRGLDEATATLRELQDKSRSLVENRGTLDANFVQLVEDLARVGDKIVEESRRDRDDLQQQVENLEHQLRELIKLMEDGERKCKEVENERKEAVDKIFELRDIIRDLEDQVRMKTTSEEDLRNIVTELEVILKKQIGDNSNKPFEVLGDVSQIEQLHQYVENLENEVQKLRLSSEIAGSEGALQQIKNHLHDFETTIDKRTRELEILHSTVSSCSSPSEDMSIRDVVHQDRSIYDECEVPLQQLARLKEKLVRHSRAEDAAVKRIRDLEMQLTSLKTDLDDSQNERDILKKQISDHLVLISNLQIRLDEQRIRAEHIEKQTNTSLEVQNYDLKNFIANLEEKIAKKDKIITQLKLSIDETKKRLEDREQEISQNKEDEIVIQMQEQLEFLRSENLKLKTKIDKEAQILPNLVENIISDKNNDIEMLKEKLDDTEKQLQFFNSLNLDRSEMESLNKLKLSGMSFNDIEDLERLRHESNINHSIAVSPNPLHKSRNETVFLENEPEISSIEKLGAPNLYYSLQIPQNKANSTEKHVRFEDEVSNTKINQLHTQIQEYQDRLLTLQDVEEKVEHLEAALKLTETALNHAGAQFEAEQQKNSQVISELQSELSEKRDLLKDKQQELEDASLKLAEWRGLLEARDAELNAERKSKIELKNSLKIKEQELKGHEDALKVQNDELNKFHDLENMVQVKDTTLAKLRKEVEHLQSLVQEKDKIIEQMEADSKSLHVNLESIQSKLTETGNVVDLGRRLREEQKKNSNLYEELHGLKAQLLSKKSIDNIAEEVQRELDYSLYLDNTILNAIGEGSLENQDVESLKLTIKKQKSVNKQLVKAKENAENKLEELEIKYEQLKRKMQELQSEDAVLIGQLRLKLDSAIINEVEFDRILAKEQSGRSQLEDQVKTMKFKINSLSSKADSLPDLHNEKMELFKKIAALEQEKQLLLHNETAMKETLKKLNVELESKTKEVLMATNLLSSEQEKFIDEKKQIVRQLEQSKSKNATDNVPDKVMEKIRELNGMVKDNMKMVDLVARLNHEKTVLEDRISVLEDHRQNLPFDDPVSRANYLFAKYLRSESYRKALAWQKQYLVSLLMTYQKSDIYEKFDIPRKKRKRVTFKNVAMVVVAVNRMKYLVRRWHSGKRIVKMSVPTNPQFQVGQPVSSQNFATNIKKETKSALNQPPKTDMPWFGTSPPSKETYTAFNSQPKLAPKNLDLPFLMKPRDKVAEHQNRLAQEPLTSPAMLSKYIERFNQIQERLGLDSLH